MPGKTFALVPTAESSEGTGRGATPPLTNTPRSPVEPVRHLDQERVVRPKVEDVREVTPPGLTAGEAVRKTQITAPYKAISRFTISLPIGVRQRREPDALLHQ